MEELIFLALVVTGGLTLLVVLCPRLIVAGLFFFILPGVILGYAAPAFSLALVFALSWPTLEAALGFLPAIPAAVLLWLGVMSLLAWLANFPAMRRVRRLALPDIVPDGPVVLAGRVRLDLSDVGTDIVDGWGGENDRRARCDGLCLALLTTPGVESVTVISAWLGQRDIPEEDGALSPAACTYRLVPRGTAAAPVIPSFETILLQGIEDFRALATEWQLRLSVDEDLVAERPSAGHDMVIADLCNRKGRFRMGVWSLGPSPVAVHEVQIRRRGEARPVLRLRAVTTKMLGRLLLPEPSGGLTDFTFGWKRVRWSSRREGDGLYLARVLQNWTNLALASDEATTAERAARRLAAMVEDPAITRRDAGWSLMEAYFTSLRRGVTARDLDLLPRLLRDRRLTQVEGIWDVMHGLGPQAGILREPLVERLATLDAEERDLWRPFNGALYKLPPGTFAEPTPLEEALLADPVRRLRVPGLVGRLHDRGKAAVPLLIAIAERRDVFDQSLDYRSFERVAASAVLAATRTALAILGPEAAAALPAMMRLHEKCAGKRWSKDYDWVLMLVRLGQPPESFEKPSGAGGSNEGYHIRLGHDAARFNPEFHAKLYF